MKKKTRKTKEILGSVPLSQLLMSVGIAALLAAAAVNTNLYRVEAFLYDLRMRWKGSEAPSAEILLLSIDDQQNSVPSLDEHLLVLKNLLSQKPRAILYLNRFDPVEIETQPAAAQAFVNLAKEAKASGTEIYLGTDVDLGGEVLPAYPLSLLPHYPAILHKDGTMFGEDKVMRRGLLTAFNEPTIHLRAAYPHLTREALLEQAAKVRGSYFYSPAESWHVLIRFPQDTTENNGGFPLLRFQEALEGKQLELAKGKILLVESLRRDAMNDFAYTPYSRATFASPRLAVHAAVLDTLLKNDGIVIVPRKIDALITFSLALILALIAITMRPSRGVVALVLFSSGLFLVSLVFFRMGYAMWLVHPLLAMFFTYYLIVPYRAILEYKKRWEVQEKHDLLVQVEEMKGNFLSLMSHDLKTPVARIQGLAELVMRQGNLLPEQQDEMRQIIDSTESLDKFISKILNLTKVESNEIKLQRKSKDINTILEQCVRKLEFQARAKQIKLETMLEPLFPIQVDSALLIQVFTNIIDNAIKYSPPGSIVRVSTREVQDSIEVSVADNGPGWGEREQERLFTKFYRGESHPGDESKGSGLGLYLAKYFIELHNGSIRAESEKGSGSKFTIQLPIKGGLT